MSPFWCVTNRSVYTQNRGRATLTHRATSKQHGNTSLSQASNLRQVVSLHCFIQHAPEHQRRSNSSNHANCARRLTALHVTSSLRHPACPAPSLCLALNLPRATLIVAPRLSHSGVQAGASAMPLLCSDKCDPTLTKLTMNNAITDGISRSSNAACRRVICIMYNDAMRYPLKTPTVEITTKATLLRHCYLPHNHKCQSSPIAN